MTDSCSIIVTDNGNEKINVSGLAKLEGANQALSGHVTIKSGGVENTIDTFHQDGQPIIKNSNSDVYNVMSQINKGRMNYTKVDNLNPQQMKDGEMILDSLVGNLQNFVQLNNNSDGTSNVSVQLSDNQIPALANVAASAFIRNAAGGVNSNRHPMAGIDGSKIQNLPKLVSEVKIDSVNLNAHIANDMIDNQKAEVTISGKDADGNLHKVVLNMDMSITNINATIADRVDLTGKQVNEVKKAGFRHGFEKD